MPTIDPERVRALARAEADSAFTGGWRAPSKKAVALAAGYKGPSAMVGKNSDIVDTVFAALVDRQNALIISTAEALKAQGVDPSIRAVAAALGVKADTLNRGRKTRFKPGLDKVISMCVTVPEVKDDIATMSRPLPPPERNCLCGCIGRTDGAHLIQGYLPECWAEYGRWRSIDEGRRQRVA
jgi:hypothetical protein